MVSTAASPRWTAGRPIGQPFVGDPTANGFAAQPSRVAALRAAPKPPTFHGFELKLPKLPFFRVGTAAKRPTASSKPPLARNVARNQTPTYRPAPQRPAPNSLTAGNGTPLNVRPANAPRTAVADVPSGQVRVATGPGSDRPVGSVRPTNPGPAMGGPQLISPSQQDGLATSPTTIEPDTPTTIEPASPADRLVMAAHESAATAESEADFTHIIETCRRARVSQPSAAVGQYADELAAWAMNRRGQVKAESGHADQAMLDFEDAVRLDPKCWRAVHNRGVLLAQTGEFAKAFDDFNRTIQIRPRFAKAYSNRAALLVVAGDLMPALVDYDRAIELDPDLAVAHRGRGRVCHFLGRLEEAIGHYDAAVQLAPEDAYAVASRADLLTDLGRYVEAAEQYERAVELDPQSAHAIRGLAWLLATSPDDAVRNADLAIARAQQAVELDGQANSLSYDTLAAAQAAAGNFPAAVETLQQAIDIAADNEREVYEDRLLLYQHAQPFRIAPLRSVSQASYEAPRR